MGSSRNGWLVQRLAVRIHAGFSGESRFRFYLERAHLPSPPSLARAKVAFSLGAPPCFSSLHDSNKAGAISTGFTKATRTDTEIEHIPQIRAFEPAGARGI